MHKLKAIAVAGRTSDEEHDRGLKVGLDCHLNETNRLRAIEESPSFPLTESNKAFFCRRKIVSTISGVARNLLRQF
jgi:hypothetical protein